MSIRNKVARFAQVGLIVDGCLHLLEVFSPYFEEAYTTLILTLIHSTIFFVSAYFIGHDLTHPHEEIDYNSWSLSKRNF